VHEPHTQPCWAQSHSDSKLFLALLSCMQVAYVMSPMATFWPDTSCKLNNLACLLSTYSP